MLQALVVFGSLVVVLQLILQPLFPWLHTLLSPVHALSCCAVIALLHPGVVAARDRMARLQGHHQHMSVDVLATDPVVNAALQMPSPDAPFRGTILALLLATAAEVASCLHGIWSATPLWEAANNCLFAGAAASMFVAARPARGFQATDLMLLAAALVGTVRLHSHEPLGAVLRAGWLQTGCLACAILRSLSFCALSIQSVLALGGAMAPGLVPSADALHARAASDVLRWGAQAAGSLLFLVPAAVRSIVPAGSDPSSLDIGSVAVGSSQLGICALTLSAWLAHFPPLLPEEEDAREDRLDEAAAAKAGYSSVDHMKAARRAARLARAQGPREPAPPPLLLDSLHRNGGVQGLSWHDQGLCRDADGDAAHEFWEALSGGTFRLKGEEVAS
jgi:hypothetical protein